MRAHFFPYAWFYDEIPFVLVAAGVVAIGSLGLGLILAPSQRHLLPLIVSLALGLLGPCCIHQRGERATLKGPFKKVKVLRFVFHF